MKKKWVVVGALAVTVMVGSVIGVTEARAQDYYIEDCKQMWEHEHYNCGVEGCTQIGEHEHYNCGVEGCEQTSEHEHYNCGVEGCEQTSKHEHTHNQKESHHAKHGNKGHH